MSGKTTLYRTNGKESNQKTVIFAGNGIFEEGWEALRHPIEQCGDGYREYLLDKEMFLLEAVEGFHDLVDERCSINRLESCFIHQGMPDNSCPTYEWPPKTIKIRDLIAKAYEEAGNLKFKDIPSYVEDKLRRKDSFVITSNWDHTLWNYSNEQLNIFQIHGRCVFPQSLIFPTEFARP